MKNDIEKKRVSSIGGQAVIEGVMMRGKSSLALAVRNPQNSITLITKRLPNSSAWYKKVPIIRGVAAFISSLYMGIGTLFQSAQVSSPEEEQLSSGAAIFALVAGVGFAVTLFILLPSLAASLITGLFGLKKSAFLFSLTEGLTRLVIFLGYMFFISRLSDIKRTFMYHGAEHKTINCYESGDELTVRNIQLHSTQHNRCGTTFLFFVIIISILFFSVINYLFNDIDILNNFLVRLLIRLAFMPLVAGLSYELLKLLACAPDVFIIKLLRAPGLALQKLTTFPPDDAMVEVALESFNAVQMLEDDADLPQINEGKKGDYDVYFYYAYNHIASMLNRIAEACETDWIFCHVLKVSRLRLRETKVITAAQYNECMRLTTMRLTGVPLDYVLGQSEFFGCKFAVNENVLVPRAETELLCECVVNSAKQGAKLLDLCTGSGCIAGAIQSRRPDIVITASDVCENALKVASENLSGVEIVKSDMFEALENRRFDVIVANPPYIKTDVIGGLQPEVRAQPHIALDGGADGLKFYRIIASEAHKHLTLFGRLYLEIGYDQADEVRELLEKNFCDIEIKNDYGGNSRIVIAQVSQARVG